MIKKQLIMENALELFAKQGIEATSIQQITERSGISKGAFYLSFKSKEELILAIVDYFMANTVADIDRIVKEYSHSSELLYHYFYTMFSMFEQHADFAKVLMMDLPKTVSETLFKRLHYFNGLVVDKLFTIVDVQFPTLQSNMRADIVHVIRGLIGIYTDCFFHTNERVDLHHLCTSIVEKVTVLAEHTTIPSVHKSHLYRNAELEERSLDEVQQLIEQLEQELPAGIARDSLALLTKELSEPSLPPAVVEGLLQNLYLTKETKWLVVFLRPHLQA